MEAKSRTYTAEEEKRNKNLSSSSQIGNLSVGERSHFSGTPTWFLIHWIELLLLCVWNCVLMVKSEPRRKVTQVPGMARTTQWMAVTIRVLRCHGNSLRNCRGTLILMLHSQYLATSVFRAPQSYSTEFGKKENIPLSSWKGFRPGSDNGSFLLLSTTRLINRGWWKFFLLVSNRWKINSKRLKRCFTPLSFNFVAGVLWKQTMCFPGWKRRLPNWKGWDLEKRKRNCK